MIRTQTEIRHVKTPAFPERGWLGVKLRELIVSRIKRSPPPQQALKERLSQKFKVTEGKKKG